ncbi:MAG: hydantoinase/oxoprolinase family protein [Hyphomicrobiaceae bacterium]
MAILLGIDTGGTYTDAVLYDEAADAPRRILAKAKSLTTHHQLEIGIDGAIGKALAGSVVAPKDIALVSMSTTLATNATVEGKGRRVALVFIGFDADDETRAGLKEALGEDPIIRMTGGHDSFGVPRGDLDLARLRGEVAAVRETVSAFAVVAKFGVVNHAHELAARALIAAETGLPVTCGHELTAKLNGPKRAVTSVLNARLIAIIDDLIRAAEGILARYGIAAPLMLVRGDGALISAAFARNRPIETILSGPAASVVGAAHLIGRDDAIVSDIGGTTTDIAVLRGGRPQLDPEGALVGGFRTMVEAVAVHTHGLGGDSEVTPLHAASTAALRLGPRRVVPLSLLAASHGDLVLDILERQLKRDSRLEHDGQFALPLRRGSAEREGLSGEEAALLARIGDRPRPVGELAGDRAQKRSLGRLVARGLIVMSGFTPSDAAHVLGLQADWRRDAALKGATLLARHRDLRSHFETSEDPAAAVSRAVIEALHARSAEVLLAAAIREDGIVDAGLVEALMRVAPLDGHHGALRLGIGLGLPLIGLGASASTYYPEIARRLGTEALISEHAGVANAVGAVVGRVRTQASTRVSAPREGIFRAHTLEPSDHGDLAAALAAVEAELVAQVRADAVAAGADDITVDIAREERTAKVGDLTMFVEALVTATASGRPRIAGH